MHGDGTTIVAIVSILATALITPLIGGFLSDRRARAERQHSDFLDIRARLDEAGSEERRMWWAYKQIMNGWSRGLPPAQDAVEQVETLGSFLEARTTVEVLATRMAIQLGPDHPASLAFDEILDLGNEMRFFVAEYFDGKPFEEDRFLLLRDRYRAARGAFIEQAHIAYASGS